MDAIYMSNASFSSAGKTIFYPLYKTVHEHERILLLGPNGSGKSTLLKVLAGLLKATGTVSIFGNAPYSLTAKHTRAFVPQQIDFPAKLKIGEIIDFVQNHFREKISKQALLDQYDLTANTYASTLSGGQKRRLALALAFLCKPRLLLLDEPESGLDVQFREAVLKEIITRTEKNRMAIIMATHFFNDTAHFFDRVMIMKEGKMIYDECMDSFLNIKNHLNRWDIYADCPESIIDAHIKDRFHYVFLGNKNIRLYTKNTTQSIEVLQKIDWPGKAIFQQNVSAEDIYLYHVGAH